MKIIYNAFKQTLLVVAGSIIGVLAVDFQAIFFGHWQLITIIVLILIFIGSGLFDKFSYQLIVLLNKINRKLKNYAILTPYEISDSENSSWVNISINDFTELFGENNIRVKKILNTNSLDKYPLVINPYGGSYPESNFHELESFNKILDYVKRGGIFVNVADIPFYYAYSKLHLRNIDTTPFAGSFRLDRSFFETLLTQKLALFVLNVEQIGSSSTKRVFILNQSTNNLSGDIVHVSGIGDGSPFVALSYGLGFFVFSTSQIEDANKENLIDIIHKAEELLAQD